MKKINLSLVIAALLTIFSLTANAQKNNTTIIVKDNVNADYFKTHLEYKAQFTGFNSESDLKKVCESISSNPSIAKCEIVGNDGNGRYDIVLVVKQYQDMVFFKRLAINNNIMYTVVNGEKKLIADLK